MTEVWRNIPGFDGKYQVSSCGSVRSIDHDVYIKHPQGDRTLHAKGRILGCFEGSNKYLYVGLTIENRKTLRLPVHQLVALAFIGPRPKGSDICHLDGNRHNNSLENIRYDSRQQNNLDVYRRGDKYQKLALNDVLVIKNLLEKGTTVKEIAQRYNVHISSIYKIRKGRTFAWLK